MRHVFLNGQKWFNQQLLELTEVVAVDGALNYLLEKGMKSSQITWVTGDFDSAILNIEVAKQLPMLDQDYTDFEKTVCYLIGEGERQLNVYFAEGAPDHDHFLGNLHVAVKYYSRMNIDFISESQRYCVLKDSKITLLASQPNKIISVIPFPTAIVSTTGLQYQLTNQRLTFGENISIRNCNTASEIGVKVVGTAIVFFDQSIEKEKIDLL